MTLRRLSSVGWLVWCQSQPGASSPKRKRPTRLIPHKMPGHRRLLYGMCHSKCHSQRVSSLPPRESSSEQSLAAQGYSSLLSLDESTAFDDRLPSDDDCLYLASHFESFVRRVVRRHVKS